MKVKVKVGIKSKYNRNTSKNGNKKQE